MVMRCPAGRGARRVALITAAFVMGGLCAAQVLRRRFTQCATHTVSLLQSRSEDSLAVAIGRLELESLAAQRIDPSNKNIMIRLSHGSEIQQLEAAEVLLEAEFPKEANKRLVNAQQSVSQHSNIELKSRARMHPHRIILYDSPSRALSQSHRDARGHNNMIILSAGPPALW